MLLGIGGSLRAPLRRHSRIVDITHNGLVMSIVLADDPNWFWRHSLLGLDFLERICSVLARILTPTNYTVLKLHEICALSGIAGDRNDHALVLIERLFET